MRTPVLSSRLGIVAGCTLLSALPLIALAGHPSAGARLDPPTAHRTDGPAVPVAAMASVNAAGVVLDATPPPAPAPAPSPASPRPAARPAQVTPPPARTGGRTDIRAIIIAAALAHGVDPSWMLRIAQCESGLDPRAVEPHGHYGLFQFLPSTYFANGGHDLWDPVEQARVTAIMLSHGQAWQWACAHR